MTADGLVMQGLSTSSTMAEEFICEVHFIFVIDSTSEILKLVIKILQIVW